MKSGRCVRFAALLLPAFALGLAASCRDIVSSDAVDTIAALCDTLDDCYGDRFPCGPLTQKAENAPAELVHTFLSNFQPETCLDTCAGSKVCLDDALFCDGYQAECEFDENCCGWSGGLTSCRRSDEEEPFRCCANDGVECSTDADCCDSPCLAGVCGRDECTTLGNDCEFSFECCSRRCDGVCVPQNCSNVGEPCLTNEECCVDPERQEVEVVCVPDPSGAGTCQILTDECTEPGLGCDPEASACCDGSLCDLAIATDQYVCVTTECKPTGFDCAEDVDCCDPLICTFGVAQSFCQVPPNECGKAGDGCGGSSDCCSGNCVDNVCLQGNGVICANVETACHSPLQEGPVIAESCEERDSCVDEVMLGDSFCACTFWDSLCVDDYLVLQASEGCE